MVDGLSVKELHEKYAYRRDVSKKWTCFDLGKFGGQIDPECRKFQKENQENCLKMLRNLLLGKCDTSLTRNKYLLNAFGNRIQRY